MIYRRICFGFLAVVFMLSLSGCVTMTNRREADRLRDQVSELEFQNRAKDQEITVLKDDLARIAQENQDMQGKIYKKSYSGEAKCRPAMKDIQSALLNAGYDPGPIDGKKGRATRQAIKEFQKANSLPVDGVAGKKTWGLLKTYLDKKIK